MKSSLIIKSNIWTNKGFTIVETLVAVAILMMAIVGPLTIVNKSLMSAMQAQDQVTASYLAQDAVEYVKNIKDNNLINGRPWLDKISQCTKDSTCSLNTLSGDPNAALGSANGAGVSNCSSLCLLYISNSGYSPDSTGTATKFSRYVYLVPSTNNPNDEVKIVVVMKWMTGVVENVITYENQIFNVIK